MATKTAAKSKTKVAPAKKAAPKATARPAAKAAPAKPAPAPKSAAKSGKPVPAKGVVSNVEAIKAVAIKAGAAKGAVVPQPAAQDKDAESVAKKAQAVVPALGKEEKQPEKLQYSGPSEGGGVEKRTEDTGPDYANTPRNAPCPCGSGKKYKKCHGA